MSDKHYTYRPTQNGRDLPRGACRVLRGESGRIFRITGTRGAGLGQAYCSRRPASFERSQTHPVLGFGLPSNRDAVVMIIQLLLSCNFVLYLLHAHMPLYKLRNCFPYARYICGKEE